MPASAKQNISAAVQPLHNPVARVALYGFFVSGLLFSFLGAMLPAWGYHLTGKYLVVGAYFLAANLGMIASFSIAAVLRTRIRASRLLALACILASASIFFLAWAPAAETPPWWRLAGVFGMGCGAGLLNTAIFHAISPLYRHDPTGTINLGGTFFGLGCVVVAVLVAGTFYVYTVPSILLWIGLIPAFFAGIYARTEFSAYGAPAPQPSWRQAVRDFKSPAAVLFTLLLFFQFGNEWALAGWLPLFLIQRLGISPEASLMMLATYWIALFAGRMVVMAMLPHVSHAKLLFGSALAALLGCMILSYTNNRFGAVSAILFAGGGFASVYPLVVERIGSRFPYYHPGFFNGIFSLAFTGGFLAPWSIGLFAHRWGVRTVMIVPFLGTCMVVILLLLLWAESKFGRTAPFASTSEP